MSAVRLSKRLAAALAAALAIATTAVASTGFQVLRIPDPAGGEIEVGLWYPADAPAKSMRFGLDSQTVADGAPVVGAGLPLVVMSHGNGGFFGSHADTARALAEAGFVAAALTHTGDNYQDQSRATDMPNRPRQFSVLIDYMLRDWRDRDQLDPERVGAFGFSSGGFTVLAAAGARADAGAILEHCRQLPDYFDCKLSRKHPPTWSAWPDTRGDGRIKAIVSAAPALGYAFTAESLAGVRAPVQLWQAEHDRVLPKPLYAEAVRDRLPARPEHHLVAGADHYDFLPPCSADMARRAAEICTPAPGFDRTAFHRTLNREVVRFFSETLRAP